MEKQSIFSQRKDLKKKGHQVVRGHYFILAFLMLIMVFFGTEFFPAIESISEVMTTEEVSDASNPGSVLDDDNIVGPDSVFDDVIRGRLKKGEAAADKNEKAGIDSATKALGRTRGVLAQLVNYVGSGKLLIMLAKSIRSATHSKAAITIIFILASFLWYTLVYIFFKNVYSAIIRRVYLDARVYETVTLADAAFFVSPRKWFKASWTMFVKQVYQYLWFMTIVGGMIKYYSYWAVPFIVAENPEIKANDAITLSRRMMKGHKWETFKFELTFIGWHLLSSLTAGFSDMFYGSAYRLACYSEYYVKLREAAAAEGIEGIQLLNDRYLFEKADRILLAETYFDVVDELTNINEQKVTLGKGRAIAASWLGVWVGSTAQKKVYDRNQQRSNTIDRYRQEMEGKAYPNWLNPLRKKKEVRRFTGVNYLRSYTIWNLFIMYILFCVLGWVWEVSLHYMQTGEFANRGTLHGPWLPIYGTGILIVMLACAHFRKNPAVEFILAVILCGSLEYFSSLSLEMQYHRRWWSYDGYFLNLDGRICAEGLLVFGVGSLIVVYIVAPILDMLLSLIKTQIVIGVSIVLGALYFGDAIYSSGNPNMAKGAVEALDKPDEAAAQTERMQTEVPQTERMQTERMQTERMQTERMQTERM